MKKLAILGASYLQLPLVKKARELNIEVHCFAWDNDEAVCKAEADFFYDISVLDKERILAQCSEIGIDGITTIATDICIPTICFVASELKLISNTYESALLCTNKALMRERFLKYNVDSPKFVKSAALKKEFIKDLIFPLIVKPTDRSGSRGVEKVYDNSQLIPAIDRAKHESFENECIIEEFVEGVEVSVEAISWNGAHHILAITDKVTTGEPFFVELEHHQPSQLGEKIQELIVRETLKALQALGINYGASHSEFKITPQGRVVAIEVGARMGGDFIGSHLVALSTGYDYLKSVIEVALGQFTNPDIDKNCYSGVYFLCKESEALLPYFQEKNDFDFEKQILKNNLTFITNSNDRSGYLIYNADKKIGLR